MNRSATAELLSDFSKLVIHQPARGDFPMVGEMLSLFGEAFDDVKAYGDHRRSKGYLERLLGGDSFIAIAALLDGRVVGGLAAYELRKFEQERSEIYIYDLAVASAHRRADIATN